MAHVATSTPDLLTEAVEAAVAARIAGIAYQRRPSSTRGHNARTAKATLRKIEEALKERMSEAEWAEANRIIERETTIEYIRRQVKR